TLIRRCAQEQPQRVAPFSRWERNKTKKQTAAPEGAAVWEPPFLTRKMLRVSYQHDACQVACINGFRRRFPLEKLVRSACRRVLRVARRRDPLRCSRPTENVGRVPTRLRPI